LPEISCTSSYSVYFVKLALLILYTKYSRLFVDEVTVDHIIKHVQYGDGVII